MLENTVKCEMSFSVAMVAWNSGMPSIYPPHPGCNRYQQDATTFSGWGILINLQLWLASWVGGRPKVCLKMTEAEAEFNKDLSPLSQCHQRWGCPGLDIIHPFNNQKSKLKRGKKKQRLHFNFDFWLHTITQFEGNQNWTSQNLRLHDFGMFLFGGKLRSRASRARISVLQAELGWW